MRCAKAQKWISRRLDGMLDGAREKALAVHLDGCDACRSYAEELARLDLDLLAAPEPSPDFAARVMQQVEGAGPRRWAVLSRSRVFRPIAAGLGAAAALGGFAVGSHFLRTTENTAPAINETVEVAAGDAVDPLAEDSVESVLIAMLSSNEE
jgi:anti-sigma factor RsiW